MDRVNGREANGVTSTYSAGAKPTPLPASISVPKPPAVPSQALTKGRVTVRVSDQELANKIDALALKRISKAKTPPLVPIGHKTLNPVYILPHEFYFSPDDVGTTDATVKKCLARVSKEELSSTCRAFLYYFENKGKVNEQKEVKKLLDLIAKSKGASLLRKDVEKQGPIGKRILRNIPVQISSYDFMNSSTDRAKALAKMKKLESEHPEALYRPKSSSFVFKTGVENIRELLSMKLEKALFGKKGAFLLKKHPITLAQKSGIASRQLHGREIWNEFSNYLKKKSGAKQALIELGGKESVPFLAFLDLVFCSFDSHILQFMVHDEEYYNFDFARFLPPSVSINIENQTQILFRSDLMNHPFVKEKIPEDLLKVLKGIEINEVKERMKPLVGSTDFYRTKYKALVSAYSEYLKDPTEKKWAEVEKFHEHCLEKVFPSAYQQMIERLEKMQGYLKQESKPTIYGIFETMYPELAILAQAMGKLTSNPFEALFNNPLEKIEKILLKSSKDRNIVSSVKTLQNKCMSKRSAIFASEFNFFSKLKTATS